MYTRMYLLTCIPPHCYTVQKACLLQHPMQFLSFSRCLCRARSSIPLQDKSFSRVIGMWSRWFQVPVKPIGTQPHRYVTAKLLLPLPQLYLLEMRQNLEVAQHLPVKLRSLFKQYYNSKESRQHAVTNNIGRFTSIFVIRPHIRQWT
jgi:hypothetical protein